MKGKNNDKPVAKYHPYIIELLKLSIIKHVAGGGYKPENNFSLMDLTDEQLDDLKLKKPDFEQSILDAKLTNNRITKEEVSKILDSDDVDFKVHVLHNLAYSSYKDLIPEDQLIELSKEDNNTIRCSAKKIIVNNLKVSASMLETLMMRRNIEKLKDDNFLSGRDLEVGCDGSVSKIAKERYAWHKDADRNVLLDVLEDYIISHHVFDMDEVTFRSLVQNRSLSIKDVKDLLLIKNDINHSFKRKIESEIDRRERVASRSDDEDEDED
jgi:hypothetical protein